MEHEAFKLTKKQNHRLPPKRGQVLKDILKYLFGSAGGKRKGDGLVSRDSVGYYPLQTLQNNFGSDTGDKPERVRGGVHS
ncbi:hypothetical protein AB3S75_039327 [Citrus x aurantiifolia]